MTVKFYLNERRIPEEKAVELVGADNVQGKVREAEQIMSDGAVVMFYTNFIINNGDILKITFVKN